MTGWNNEPDQAGLEAAMRFAGWELGDAGWGRRIVRYYLNPQEAHAAMDADDIPARTGQWSAW